MRRHCLQNFSTRHRCDRCDVLRTGRIGGCQTLISMIIVVTFGFMWYHLMSCHVILSSCQPAGLPISLFTLMSVSLRAEQRREEERKGKERREKDTSALSYSALRTAHTHADHGAPHTGQLPCNSVTKVKNRIPNKFHVA